MTNILEIAGIEDNEDQGKQEGLTWSKQNPDKPKHLHPKHGGKPIGIFKCLEESPYSYQNISFGAASYVFAKEGFIPLTMPQDLELPYDMMIKKGEETYTVQLKATTQRSRGGKTSVKTKRWETPTERRKKRKSEISLRGNMASSKRGGNPTRPHEYDILFAINEEGEYCWWWEKDIRENKSTVVFGVNCGHEGKLG